MPNYKLPKSIEAYTLHQKEPGSPKTTSVEQYVNSHGFCLTSDLLNYGFKPEDIENSVNSEKINAAPWPKNNSVTDLYFSKDSVKLKSLENLTRKVSSLCNHSENLHFSKIFSFFGHSSRVVAGLVYAREQGKIIEVHCLEEEKNPRYSISLSNSEKKNLTKSLLLVPALASLLFSHSGSYDMNPASFLNEGDIKERWKKRKKK